MDVKANKFRSHLPFILEAISRAHFVSFDLELSGIPGRQRGQSRAPGEAGAGKQTLQERYEDTKKAAERYQILQLGLTCVEEDRERGLYRNLRICPKLTQSRGLCASPVQLLPEPCTRQKARR